MSDPFMKFTGVSLDVLVTAFFGGVASMIIVPGGIIPRLASFAMGILSAIFLSPYAIFMAKMFSSGGGDSLERAVVFMTGFLGMSVLAGVYAVAERFRHRATKIVDKTIDKIG
jgi:hypothetical protein